MPGRLIHLVRVYPLAAIESVTAVYGLRNFQIIGAAQWKAIMAARYQMEGMGPESATEAQLKEMAKTLLAERFQLRVHKETRVRSDVDAAGHRQ